MYKLWIDTHSNTLKLWEINANDSKARTSCAPLADSDSHKTSNKNDTLSAINLGLPEKFDLTLHDRKP